MPIATEAHSYLLIDPVASKPLEPVERAITTYTTTGQLGLFRGYWQDDPHALSNSSGPAARGTWAGLEPKIDGFRGRLWHTDGR